MLSILLSFFFFNDTATTEIYTLSLHDALPICSKQRRQRASYALPAPTTMSSSLSTRRWVCTAGFPQRTQIRSEEHTSELQSRQYLVCRLLLEKKTMRIRRGKVGSQTL